MAIKKQIIYINFVLLKYIFYILIFTVGLHVASAAQTKPTTTTDGSVRLLKLYPIPATTYINFDFVSGYDKSLSFQVFNFTGKKVYELQTVPPKIYLALTDFTRGFYYYQLRDKSGKLIETVRFLVLK